MTTIQVIPHSQYQQQLKDKIGTLMFPDELHNSTGYVDLVKLRKNIKDQIPKGKKIVGVIVHTTSSPNFKKIANRQQRQGKSSFLFLIINTGAWIFGE